MKPDFLQALRRWPYFAGAAVCVAADQITKRWVVKDLKPIGDYPLWEGVFHLTYTENRGAAFGILQDARWLFLILSTVGMLAIAAFLLFYHPAHRMCNFALAMVLGGGVGNMIDRIGAGYVVDFLYAKCINFAIFNVADCFVCVGIGLLVLYMLVFELRKPQTEKGTTHE